MLNLFGKVQQNSKKPVFSSVTKKEPKNKGSKKNLLSLSKPKLPFSLSSLKLLDTKLKK